MNRTGLFWASQFLLTVNNQTYGFNCKNKQERGQWLRQFERVIEMQHTVQQTKLPI